MPSEQGRPQYPDLDFAKRFLQTSRYAFYMRYEGGDTAQSNETLEEIESERWVVLDLNPQQIRMSEPVATSLTFTQGGGKIRESRGGLVKPISISGTTGFTPLPQAQALHSVSPKNIVKSQPVRGSLIPADKEQLDTLLAERSGFWAFHRLRHLFRRYAFELRQGRTDITMNYIDTKNEEYWRVEPQEFTMTRSSRKPFMYDYSISMQAIEESTSVVKSDDETRAFFGLNSDSIVNPGVKQSLNRMTEMNGSATDFLKHLSGKTERLLQSSLRSVNSVVGYFENAHDAFTTVLTTPLVLLSQLDNTLAGISAVSLSLNEDVSTLYTFVNTGELSGELNEWYLEMQHLSDFLKANVIATIRNATNLDVVRENRKYATGQAKQGTATAVMQPTAGSTGSPDTNPFLNSSGLGLVTDVTKLAKSTSVRTVVVNSGDTIWSLAQRLLGDTRRFIDLVLLNNLQSPYIVASKTAKPSGTIAWGEIIQVPDFATGSLVTPLGPPQLAPTLSGTVSDTGTLYELIDTSFTENGLPGWIPNQWTGYTVTVTHLGVEYQRVVIGNDKDHLQINIAWPILLSVDDPYRLELIEFHAHRPVTPEVATFGSDVLLKFVPAVGNAASSTLCDVVINARRDLALARGLNNFIQAVNIRARVEQGRLPLHLDFGLQIPVGRPWSEDMGLLYKYQTRASMLRDPRVQKVTNMKISLQASTFTFTADVQPIKVKNLQPVSVTLP